MKYTTFLQDGQMVQQVWADPENLRVVAEYCRHLGEQKQAISGDMVVLGEVPGEVVQRYIDKAGITLQDFLQNKAHHARLLNDPENSCFRVYKGKVRESD